MPSSAETITRRPCGTARKMVALFQGEEFAAITPQRLQIPAVTASSVVKAKIIRDMEKKPNADVSSPSRSPS